MAVPVLLVHPLDLFDTGINLREKPPLHRNYAQMKEFGTFSVP